MASAAIVEPRSGYEEYRQRVADMAPLIRKHLDASERRGDLSPEVTDRLRDEGFYRLSLPAGLGGSGLKPSEAFRIFEALSRIHSAVGWNVTQSNNLIPFAVSFGEDVQNRIFGDPATVWAGSFNPPSKLVRDGEGWRINGHTPFNSNLGAANWIGGLGLLHDDQDQPVMIDGAPAMHLIIFRKSDAQVAANWNVMGMKATGSNDLRVDDIAIPFEQAVPFGRPESPIGHFDGPHYFAGAWPTAPNNAVNAFGVPVGGHLRI